MGLNYIPPKNMVTEEFIGNTVPQGSVFLKPLMLGPKYKIHYKEQIVDQSEANDILTLVLPSIDDLTDTTPKTRLVPGSPMYPYYVYLKYLNRTFKLSNKEIFKDVECVTLGADATDTGTYGHIDITDNTDNNMGIDDLLSDLSATYHKFFMDLDTATRSGEIYLKLVEELAPQTGVTGYRTYEYYDASVNFTSVAQGIGYTFDVFLGLVDGSLITQDANSAKIHIIAVEGNKIKFKVIFPDSQSDFTNDPVMPNQDSAVLTTIDSYIVTSADTDGLSYIQISPELTYNASDMDFYVSYRELDLEATKEIKTVTRDSVINHFPYDSITDRLGKMVYTALQSGAQVVQYLGLPYDEEYEDVDLLAFQNALDIVGEGDGYFIVNYDYKNTTHPTLKAFLQQYEAKEISKPMTAAISLSDDTLKAVTGINPFVYDGNEYTIANAISDYAKNTIDYRRMVLMWPNKVAMYSGDTYIDDEFNELITDSYYGSVVEGGGMYAAAAYMGLRSSKTPQQGLTNSVIPGLAYVKHSSDVFKKTLPTQPLNVIAGGGVTILYQETNGSYVTVYHQLSTAMDDVRKKEFNKTVCYDYAAYYLLSISPKRGTQSWTEPVIGYEIGLMHAGCKELVKAGVLTYAKVGTPTLVNDELDIPIIVDAPTPDNYKIINLKIRG